MMLKTKSEQRLEYLESLKRPLTTEESDELRRALHAVYQHERRQSFIQMDRDEELKLLDRLREEAAMPEWYPHE